MGNNWINANEQTPNEGEHVLVFGFTTGVNVGIYHDGEVKTEWSDDETVDWNKCIFCWMPIPEISFGKK